MRRRWRASPGGFPGRPSPGAWFAPSTITGSPSRSGAADARPVGGRPGGEGRERRPRRRDGLGDTASTDVEDWYARLLARHPQLEVRGVLGPWALVDRYVKNGPHPGLHPLPVRPLARARSTGTGRAWTARSTSPPVWPACSTASSSTRVLRRRPRRTASRCCMDVRDKTQQWCFDTYQRPVQPADALHAGPAGTPHPRPGHRPEGAHGVWLRRTDPAAAMSGSSRPRRSSGWNGGDEFKTTRLVHHLRPLPDGHQLVHEPAGPDGRAPEGRSAQVQAVSTRERSTGATAAAP